MTGSGPVFKIGDLVVGDGFLLLPVGQGHNLPARSVQEAAEDSVNRIEGDIRYADRKGLRGHRRFGLDGRCAFGCGRFGRSSGLGRR